MFHLRAAVDGAASPTPSEAGDREDLPVDEEEALPADGEEATVTSEEENAVFDAPSADGETATPKASKNHGEENGDLELTPKSDEPASAQAGEAGKGGEGGKGGAATATRIRSPTNPLPQEPSVPLSPLLPARSS